MTPDNRYLAEKWRSVEHVKDNDLTHLLMHRAATTQPQEGFSDKRAGNVIIYTDPDKNLICEAVAGTREDDCIATLYRPNPIFNSPATLRQARIDLITMIEDMHEAIEGNLQGKCRARNRRVDLSEMPTIQLIDVLGDLVRKRYN